MAFYGSKADAAELAGVNESEATDAKADLINAYIDTTIRIDGFVSKNADEYYDIYKTNQDELVLKNFPVISITELYSEANTDTPLLIDVASYVIDELSGILQLIDTKTVSGNGITYFHTGKNSTRVKYSYGYATVPSLIAEFATMLLARYLSIETKMTETGVLKSVRIGNYTETYGSSYQTRWDLTLSKMEDRLQAFYAEGV